MTTTTDAQKLRACPPPNTLPKLEREMWEDLVTRLPLDALPKAHRGALAAYCRLSVKQKMLSQSRTPDVQEIGKLARVLRSTALRISLPQLLLKGSRSNDDATEAVANDVLHAWDNPDHPRYGLMGCRVRDIPTSPAVPETPPNDAS